MQIHPRVTQISTHFNGTPVELYFIKGQRNAIIDTGTTQSPREDIAPALSALGLSIADIDMVLNSHGHFDHAAGNAAVKEASNAKIFIHKDDVFFLEDHERCFQQYLAPAVEAIRGKEFFEEEKANFIKRAGEEVTVDRKLEDNDHIDLGDGIELRVIHLPGHTSGSVGYYWKKEGILFSGDAVPGLHSEGGRLPIIWDLPRYEKSLERLQEIPIKILLCAHHYRGLNLPPSPIKRGEEVRQYLQDSQQAAKQIAQAIRYIAPRASDRPFMEVANEAISRLPKEMGFTSPMETQSIYSAMTILSHLRQVNR